VWAFRLVALKTDVIMLVMNKSAIDKLLSSKFTIGPMLRWRRARGPYVVGCDGFQLRAEILTYSRARGLFAGISLEARRCGLMMMQIRTCTANRCRIKM